MRNIIFICALAIYPLTSAEAAMFKCVEDGKVTYQATPCHGSGEAINVLPADATPTSDAGVSNEPGATAARFDEQSKTFTLEHRLRDINYETKNLEAEIAEYQSAMSAELEALQKKKEFWKNQLGGKTWEQNVADEMQSVTDKYTKKIQAAQDKLTPLNKERDDINRQLSRNETSGNRPNR